MLLQFQKGDIVRHLGLLDLQRTMQRALRRSVPVLKNGENTLLWMPGVRPAEICRGRKDGVRMLVSFENRFAGGFLVNGKHTK